jgi:hypothetical protein
MLVGLVAFLLLMVSCVNMYTKYNSEYTENNGQKLSKIVEKSGENLIFTTDSTPEKIVDSETMKRETVISDSAADAASNNMNDRELQSSDKDTNKIESKNENKFEDENKNENKLENENWFAKNPADIGIKKETKISQDDKSADIRQDLTTDLDINVKEDVKIDVQNIIEIPEKPVQNPFPEILGNCKYLSTPAIF